jgi:hypothetical protein
MSPQAMNADGFSYGNRMNFVNRYGVLEKVTRYYPGDDNICSKGKTGTTVTREKPGVSPAIFSNHLMGSTVFLHLQDIALDLPELREEVVPIAMEEDLATAYRDLEHRIGYKMKQLLAMGSRRLLGTYLNTLLCYPDRPFHNEPVIDPANGNVIAEPAHLPSDRIYSKENQLLDIIHGEISQGRRCFVYCTFTNTKDVTGRLKEIVARQGLCVEILRSSVKPEQREGWLRQKVREDVHVVIANPMLVQTGLDLLDFPTIIFYQTGYSVFTLRQASRRSWRIGQDKPVRIHYLHYAGTMQERAIELVGKKLSASLAIEGKLTDDGLASMCAGEDMTLLLAKALVEGTHIQGAESVWCKLNRLKQTPIPANVIPLRRNWTLELMEERSGTLWDDFSVIQGLG